MGRRVMDLAGQVFGRLTAIEPAGYSQAGVIWACRCVCGHPATATTGALRRGERVSCGCAPKTGGGRPHPDRAAAVELSTKIGVAAAAAKYGVQGSQLSLWRRLAGLTPSSITDVDLTGRKFGKLTLERKSGADRYRCICECGAVEFVHSSSLVRATRVACVECQPPPGERSYDEWCTEVDFSHAGRAWRLVMKRADIAIRERKADGLYPYAVGDLVDGRIVLVSDALLNSLGRLPGIERAAERALRTGAVCTTDRYGDFWDPDSAALPLTSGYRDRRRRAA